jgi:dihydrolipoamide dehydrogenase
VSVLEVRVPDLGDVAGVEIIEVLVEPGQQVEAEAPLVTLESDKATLELPAPQAGRIEQIAVKVGSKVSTGDLVLTLAAEGRANDEASSAAAGSPAATSTSPRENGPASGAGRAAASAGAEEPRISSASSGRGVDLVVIGAGPGGYTAAFRAADRRALAHAWRRLPQCGLHPLQGFVARGPSDRGNARDGRSRYRLRRAAH